MGKEYLPSKLTQISSKRPFFPLPDLLFKNYRFLQILGIGRRIRKMGKACSFGHKIKMHHILFLGEL